jgi:TatD DNase family protein
VIDSHTHIDHVPGEDADIIAAARNVGVNRILTIGMDSESCRTALALSEQYEGTVFASVGRHPNAASGFDASAAAELQVLAQHPCCRAIGETGLDYFRDYAPREEQRAAFAAQIEIAREADKPLIIHTRAAEDDTIEALERHAEGVTVIMHCFSMPDRLEECVENGWYISFAGNVTYPSAKDLAAAAERVPLERLLVETDAPWLSPQQMRKERNQPANVVHTAEFIADIRGIGYGELERAVEETAARLFRW